MNTQNLFNKWFLYEGEETPPVIPPVDPPEKTFTQEEVNRFNKEERLKRETAETKTKELNTLVQDLQNQQNMSADEKAALVTKLEELETANLTSEQQLARSQKKTQEEFDAKLNKANEDSETWQARYSNERIRTALLLAAEGDKDHAKAYNAEQINDLLQSKTVITPVLDEEGEPTGEFQTMVKGFNDTDTDGNPIKSDLSVTDAVNRMREMDRYANLFQNTAISGLDLMANGRTGKPKSEEKLSVAEYAKLHREKKLSHQRS